MKDNPEYIRGWNAAMLGVEIFCSSIDSEFLTAEQVRKIFHKWAEEEHRSIVDGN